MRVTAVSIATASQAYPPVDSTDEVNGRLAIQAGTSEVEIVELRAIADADQIDARAKRPDAPPRAP